jgi:hypothetical protein
MIRARSLQAFSFRASTAEHGLTVLCLKGQHKAEHGWTVLCVKEPQPHTAQERREESGGFLAREQGDGFKRSSVSYLSWFLFCRILSAAAEEEGCASQAWDGGKTSEANTSYCLAGGSRGRIS